MGNTLPGIFLYLNLERILLSSLAIKKSAIAYREISNFFRKPVSVSLGKMPKFWKKKFEKESLFLNYEVLHFKRQVILYIFLQLLFHYSNLEQQFVQISKVQYERSGIETWISEEKAFFCQNSHFGRKNFYFLKIYFPNIRPQGKILRC